MGGAMMENVVRCKGGVRKLRGYHHFVILAKAGTQVQR